MAQIVQLRQPPFSRRLRNVLYALAGLIALGFIAAHFLYIAEYRLNVPLNDAWGTSARTAVMAARGQITAEHLFLQHNVHRMVFTRLIAIALTPFGWDTRVEVYLRSALMVVNLLILTATVRHYFPRVAPFALAAFAALLFTPRMYRTWFWNLVEINFVLFFLFLAIYILHRYSKGWWPVVLAAALAFAASFSFFAGLLAWPTLLIMLLLREGRRWQHLVFWAIAALVAFALYFINLDLGAETVGEPGASGFDLGLMIQFVVSFLAGPLSNENMVPVAVTLVLVAGAITLVNMAYQYLRLRSWAPLAPWLSLAAFAVASGIITAGGRLEQYLDRDELPFTERYVPQQTELWLAVVALSLITVVLAWRSRRQSWARWLAPVNVLFLTALAALYAVQVIPVLRSIESTVRVTRAHEACLLAYPLTQDYSCMAGLHPTIRRPQGPTMVLDRIAQLNALHLGPFSGDEERIKLGLLLPIATVTGPDADAVAYTPVGGFGGEPEDILAVPAGTALAWQLTLPADLRAIVLETAYRVDELAAGSELAFQIVVDGDLEPRDVLVDGVPSDEWTPVEVDLSPYQGQSITLSLVVDGDTSGDEAAYWREPTLVVAYP